MTGAGSVKPEFRNNWSQEDLGLEREFEDVADVWHKDKSSVPSAPNRLDRQVRKLACYHIGGDLQQNWLFGQGPRLATAMSIFFAVGVYFVLSLDTTQQEYPSPSIIKPDVDSVVEQRRSARREADEREFSRERALDDFMRTSAADEWAGVSFVASEKGIPESIVVVESCVKTFGKCQESPELAAYAIDIVKAKRFLKSGPQEEIVVRSSHP
ncbi:MAG TPA: hypothetical protein DCM54_09215 [Gammaproteobacteria bacterium]|nr:hypothetical protein [Gammaproteobacteria bacterium]|tara:strand:+ start:1349 stop:1984 length:636 start_codon:yes stop_codon:yes gene_type:complete